jgi:hypothetical protein
VVGDSIADCSSWALTTGEGGVIGGRPSRSSRSGHWSDMKKAIVVRKTVVDGGFCRPFRPSLQTTATASKTHKTVQTPPKLCFHIFFRKKRVKHFRTGVKPLAILCRRY